MKKIILVDAAHDENGKDGYEGSIPGDQTGDEVRNIEYERVRDFWWKGQTVVFRAKGEHIANAIAIRMQQAKDNVNCGYSQPGRRAFYEQLQKDYDPSHIKVPVEGDCSSYINACVYVTLKSCGEPDTEKIYPYGRTADMPAMYTRCNAFENVTNEVDLSDGSGLKKGDILVIPNVHTAMVWDVIEEEDPIEEEPKDLYRATTEVYLRTGPGVLYRKCNVQMKDNMVIRNFLYKGEAVPVIGETGGWYQVEMKGVFTWTPWVSKKYMEKV